MLMQQQQQTNPSGLPEVVRVMVQRGFRAPVDGVFGAVNPGDVVDIPRGLAMEMRAAGRAFMVDPAKEDAKRQKNYAPERKRHGKTADPVQQQLAAMTKAVEGLQAVVEQLAADRAKKS